MFTYHKYRKSVYSPVPLDAHGNPVAIDLGTRPDTFNEQGDQVELNDVSDQDNGHVRYQVGSRSVDSAESQPINYSRMQRLESQADGWSRQADS